VLYVRTEVHLQLAVPSETRDIDHIRTRAVEALIVS